MSFDVENHRIVLSEPPDYLGRAPLNVYLDVEPVDATTNRTRKLPSV